MSLIKQTAFSAASAVLMTATRFLMSIYIARNLDVNAFGRFVYFQWVVDLGFLVFSFGMAGVVSRYIPQYRNDPKILTFVLKMWKISSIIFPLIGAFFSILFLKYSGYTIEQNEFICYLILCYANGVMAMSQSAMVGMQRFDIIFNSNLIFSVLISLGLVAVFYIGDRSVESIYLAIAMSCAFAAFGGFREIWNWTLKSDFSQIDGVIKKEIINYALNVWISALLWNLVWSRGEVLAIKHFLNDKAVAQYSVALTLYGGGVSILMLLVGGIAPQITKYIGERDVNEAVRLCRFAMDIQLMACGIGGLIFVWLSNEIVQFTYGNNYSESTDILNLLSIGLPAFALASHNHFIQVITNAKFTRNATVFGVFFLGFSAVVFIAEFGAVGGAASRSITILLLALISMYYFVRLTRMEYRLFVNFFVVEFLLLLSYFFNLQNKLNLDIRIVLLCILIFLIFFILKNEKDERLSIMLMREINYRIGSLR